MVRIFLMGLLMVSLWLQNSPATLASVNPDELGKAVTAIEQLDQMRIGLASTLEGSTTEPTLDTFKAVCAPVGKKAKEIAAANGWQLRQVALKYRNPNHAPRTALEVQALNRFDNNRQLQAFWQTDAEGVHYFRRIDVQVSCLACHGAKNRRPAFIQEKYPSDRAYGFRVGDLRGMYAVTIPQIQQARQTSP
ncbi:DUF3365 domain-containing protein [Thermosynechococcus sp. JY1334]|uniref:Tll0287-like domain-containing protein n=1 Tax=unclassified Thermosynechococcus TaxID=2622553 RepID=UPI00267218B9|nr:MULTISPECIES: DUF3365 domain-containing protein [unclassified Thermosynechococcus]MDR7897380.1 DUF3365 domain-containing protein [Thermosynechococcus sp. JY1332]MDR7904783.1 DUF3365 domain-containing protein [Thermosynechococcus sp. JY1334]MDR7992608.1 DUF3365 domain-containing protein [Thermosynechococcus sp. TG252]WKT87010.1 DUF3365 domain-containing protein [Thermosynechococcus sp. JY1339]WNC55953.1 DUF3365 domain-containing protein [Thermosynechococcus sp. JY1331]